MLVLPRLPRGRPSSGTLATYDSALQAFCELVLKINSTCDFRVSSRGQAYQLEPHGLHKDHFDDAQAMIAECRRRRLLPMDICAEDGARAWHNLENLDDDDPAVFAEGVVEAVATWHQDYKSVSFWDGKDVYLQMMVEKIDLKSLFGPYCEKFYIPIANARGWSDLNVRWAALQRIMAHVRAGRRCVLLYCGDHDPAGLNISDTLRKNLAELLTHREWLELMDHLVIDRFGLNYDFITTHNLTWIDNLKTGSGGDLADPKHKDHKCDYVQNYIKQFGVRKCEANALVVQPEAGRELCRRAILKYLPADAPARYEQKLAPYRQLARQEILRQLREVISDGGSPL
jgi:hypothetical protein